MIKNVGYKTISGLTGSLLAVSCKKYMGFFPNFSTEQTALIGVITGLVGGILANKCIDSPAQRSKFSTRRVPISFTATHSRLDLDLPPSSITVPERPVRVPLAAPVRVEPGDGFQVTADSWAVSLVVWNNCRSKRSENRCSNLHTVIIIEGINEKGYFCKMAHLAVSATGKEGVSIKDFTDRELNYVGFDRHFKESSDVKKMLEKIEEQAKITKENKLDIKLNPMGSSSFAAKKNEESCITWARKQMEFIDIPVSKSFLDKIATMPQLHTTSKFTERVRQTIIWIFTKTRLSFISIWLAKREA